MTALAPAELVRLTDPAHLAGMSTSERAKAKALLLQYGKLTGLWLGDPVGWVSLGLGGWLSRQQQAVIEAVRDHPRTVISAGHSVGKSKSVARLVLWWVENHAPGDAFVVSTAPTYSQVRAIIWREIRAEHRSANLSGRINQVEWIDAQGDLVAFGRKPSDYDTAAFQGIHAPYVLVVLDEASGVPGNLWEDAEKLVTGAQHRLVAIGNPDHQGSYFHQMTTTPGWHHLRLSVLDSPNFTDERDAAPDRVLMSLAQPAWVEDRAARFGVGSPTWMRQVTGEFPAVKEGGLIPRPWMQACAHPDTLETVVSALTHGRPHGPVPEFWGRPAPRVQLGVDVAAGGEDRTVIRERRERAIGRWWEMDTDDSEEIIDKVTEIVAQTGATRVVVDSIGVGWGVMNGLRRRDPTLEVLGFNAAEAPDPNLDPGWPKFRNKRAQLWWAGREMSRLGLWDLTLAIYDQRGGFQRDDPTVDDLAAPTYLEKAGVVEVESKDDIRKELGRSPDHGEAALMSFWVPARMRARIVGAGGDRKEGWSV